MAYQPELDKLQRQYGDDPGRYFAQLAEAYRRGGRLDEALAMLREHLAGRPNYVSGLVVLGRCLLDQHNDGEARETFERVIVVDREHIIALKALGEIGERTGDVAGARLWYQRLLEIDPMNDEAEAALGRIPLVAAAPPPAPAPPPAAEAPAAEPPAPPAPPVRFEAPPPEAPAPEPAAAWEPEPPVAPEAPERGFEVKRASGERESAPDEVPWAPAARDAGDDRAVEFEDVQGPVLDQASRTAGDDDLAGWVEHPEELLNFEEPAEPPKGDEEFAVEPFDESLGWGAGERVSRQITADDLQEAERAHAEDLAAPVQGLPGLEGEPVPSDPAAALPDGGTLDGLQQIEADATAELLPGLETEGDMLMPPEAPPPQAPAFVPGTTGEDDGGRASLAGLPVFFPPDEETREPLRVESEPEPVVTETMAELYVRQGLVSEARETYRQLLAARPHDRRLAARLAELHEAGPARDARTVYAAAATGGQTSRDFLAEVLGGRMSAAVEAAASPMVQPAEVDQVPLEPEPMDEAFGDEPEPRGEPTQPATDEISLAAIFGEQTASSPAPPVPPSADPGNRDPGGFSFDEFFSAVAPGAPEAAPPPRPPRDTLADDEGEEAFRDWLKGLKS
jgi:tetratricopeptide (TPR) repeat protein